MSPTWPNETRMNKAIRAIFEPLPPVPALATLSGAKISCSFTGRFPTREHVHVLGGIAHPKVAVEVKA